MGLLSTTERISRSGIVYPGTDSRPSGAGSFRAWAKRFLLVVYGEISRQAAYGGHLPLSPNREWIQPRAALCA